MTTGAIFSSLAPFPLAKAETALWVGKGQAPQSLNVYPNAFGRPQAHLYFISLIWEVPSEKSRLAFKPLSFDDICEK